MTNFTTADIPHIIIVGGGAGGLELATLLGRKFGRSKQAKISLIDYSATHLWKPLLHEVAAGVLNSNEDEINYLALASQNYFHFTQGKLAGLDRAKKQIKLAALVNPQQEMISSAKVVSYDILVIAIGSIANDFNIPGVLQHAVFLDSRVQADFFHQHLLQALNKFADQAPAVKNKFTITVVGGGATGIELIAELHHALRLIANYGVDFDPDQVVFSLIEAADRLLPALPERLSKIVTKELLGLNVQIYLNEKVAKATDKGFETASGKFIPGDIRVWTAGIKAPEVLRNMDGLAVNNFNQLLVKPTLQTTEDDSIFALGDCASCPQTQNQRGVPPRAQAAHQEALFLVNALGLFLENKKLPNFHYHDYGSLISLSRYNNIGSLMGKITRSYLIEGKLARFFYISLYKKHLAALYGPWRVFLLTLANSLSRRVRPRLKLH